LVKKRLYLGIDYYENELYITWEGHEFPSIAIIGPSGSRKSLFLVRGIIEQLLDDDWTVGYITIKPDFLGITQPNTRLEDIHELAMFHFWWFSRQGWRTKGVPKDRITVYISPFDERPVEEYERELGLNVEKFRIPIPHIHLEALQEFYGGSSATGAQYFKETREAWEKARHTIRDPDKLIGFLSRKLIPDITRETAKNVIKSLEDRLDEKKDEFIEWFRTEIDKLEIEESISRRLADKLREILDRAEESRTKTPAVIRELVGEIRGRLIMSMIPDEWARRLIGRLEQWIKDGKLVMENVLEEKMREYGQLLILYFPESELTSTDVGVFTVFINAFTDIAERNNRKNPRHRYALIVDDIGSWSRGNDKARSRIALEHLLLRKGRGSGVMRIYIGQKPGDFTGVMKDTQTEMAFDYKIATTKNSLKTYSGNVTRSGVTCYLYTPSSFYDWKGDKIYRGKPIVFAVKPPLSSYERI